MTAQTPEINIAASMAAQTFAVENWVVYSAKVEPFELTPEIAVLATLECNFGTEYVIARFDGELAYGPSLESATNAWVSGKGNGVGGYRSAPVKTYRAETLADAVVRQYR